MSEVLWLVVGVVVGLALGWLRTRVVRVSVPVAVVGAGEEKAAPEASVAVPEAVREVEPVVGPRVDVRARLRALRRPGRVLPVPEPKVGAAKAEAPKVAVRAEGEPELVIRYVDERGVVLGEERVGRRYRRVNREWRGQLFSASCCRADGSWEYRRVRG